MKRINHFRRRRKVKAIGTNDDTPEIMQQLQNLAQMERDHEERIDRWNRRFRMIRYGIYFVMYVMIGILLAKILLLFLRMK